MKTNYTFILLSNDFSDSQTPEERERERARRESTESDLETQTSTIHLKHILARLTPRERRPIP